MKFETRVESLAWYALMKSFNLGLGSTYRESDFVKYIWVTPRSEKNCKICRSMNGIELSLEDIGKLCPAHPSCSCILMPKA